MKIDKKIIEELVKYLKEFNLSEIEYAEGTTKVKVSRATNSSSIITSEANKKKTTIESNGTNVTSPIVGTAYLAPEPGAKKFVEVGQKVKTFIGTLKDLSLEKKYQLIVANISSKVIIDSLPKISAHLDVGGHGILCGILIDRSKEIEKHIKDAGLEISANIISEEWVCFSVSKSSIRI